MCKASEECGLKWDKTNYAVYLGFHETEALTVLMLHLLIYRHNLCDSLEASQIPIKIDCDLTYFALYRTCCQKHEVHFGKPALMLIKVEPRLSICVCVKLLAATSSPSSTFAFVSAAWIQVYFSGSYII